MKRSALKDPRWAGVACASAAVALGAGYLAAAGAPASYLAVNLLALALGLATLVAVRRPAPEGLAIDGVSLGLAVLLLATALFGTTVEGATRWTRVGPISVQVSLVVLPLMLVVFARRRSAFTTASLCIAAAALAMQPDRAMAGVLAAGLAALALRVRDRWTLLALLAALGGFAAALLQPDTLAPTQYVERVLYSAFDVHLLAGLAVVVGAALLVVPAVVGVVHDGARREVYWLFGAVWLAAVAAAAVGNYPTPVVGYGGSAVLGYLLSLLFLPSRAEARERTASPAGAAERDRRDGGSLLPRAVAGPSPAGRP